MLFYTGITRVSSEILKEQDEMIFNNMPILDRMVEMTEKARDILEEDSTTQWGNMLDAAWNLKKQLAGKISTPAIEEMYLTAKRAGALGGKILGAGGGGFLLVYVPVEKQGAVRKAMMSYKQVSFAFEPEGSRIIFMEENRR